MANILTYNLRQLHLAPGRYKIQVIATDGPTYRPSDLSNELYYQVGYAVAVTYPSGSHNAPKYVGDSAFTITLTPNPGQYAPTAEDIHVQNATFSYSIAENIGTLVISHQTGDIGIRITGDFTVTAISKDDKALLTDDDYYLIFAD